MGQNNIEQYISKLKIPFKDISLYTQALSHTSYAHECKRPDQSYERLEFLGDAVLELFVSDYFYRNHSELNEGAMTKNRAAVVREESLVEYAQALDLPKHMLLGKGEANSGGYERAAIIADSFEALLGAIYLDLGLDVAFSYATKWIVPFIESEQVLRERDFKTALQELIQGDGIHEIFYEIISEKGPAHNKEFTASITLDEVILGTGIGRTKKEAEQKAAESALNILAKKKVEQ